MYRGILTIPSVCPNGSWTHFHSLWSTCCPTDPCNAARHSTWNRPWTSKAVSNDQMRTTSNETHAIHSELVNLQTLKIRVSTQSVRRYVMELVTTEFPAWNITPRERIGHVLVGDNFGYSHRCIGLDSDVGSHPREHYDLSSCIKVLWYPTDNVIQYTLFL